MKKQIMSDQDTQETTLTLQFANEEGPIAFEEWLEGYAGERLCYMVENIEDADEAIAFANMMPEPYNEFLLDEWTKVHG